MTDDPTLDAEPDPRRRRGLLVAAAAAVVVIAGVAVALAAGDDGPTADEEAIALTAEAQDITQMCIEVTADTMRDSGIELAFRGTVTAVDGDVATFAVDEWFLGGEAGTVTVTGPAEADTALLGAVPLEEGGAYLISASDGLVRSCGQSGEASSELEAIYAEAFGG